ncbi:MAG: hypothetical protein R3F39_20285 [Myxococcota bacterium]
MNRFLFGVGLALLLGVGCDAAESTGGADIAVGLDAVAAGAGDLPMMGAAACEPSWEPPTAALVAAERSAQHTARFHADMGRFLDGSTPVFVGTFSARDTRGGWDSEHGDGVVESGAALAWVGPETWPGPGRLLVVVEVATGRAVSLRQLDSAPGRTEGSLVMDCSGSYSYPSSCTGCVAPLDLGAEKIQLAPTELAGKWWSGGQPANLSIEVSLTRVAAADVTVEQALTLGGSACTPPGLAAAFRVEEGALVTTVSDYWNRSVDAPGCSVACAAHEGAPRPDGVSVMGGCYQELQWSGEVYAPIEDPSAIGLRDVQLGAVTVCCNYADPCGGAALFNRCFAE